MTNLTNDAVIKKDRLRFTKNKLSANLTLLAIVFNALYFVDIYRSDVQTYYYQWIIGVSVVYNLLFMLAAFLSEEGVKGYKMGYAYTLIGLGIAQIVRIFILPMQAHSATVRETVTEEGQQVVKDVVVMGDTQFIWVIVCLVASAALCVIAGIVGIMKTRTLVSYQAELAKRPKGSTV